MYVLDVHIYQRYLKNIQTKADIETIRQISISIVSSVTSVTLFLEWHNYWLFLLLSTLFVSTILIPIARYWLDSVFNSPPNQPILSDRIMIGWPKQDGNMSVSYSESIQRDHHGMIFCQSRWKCHGDRHLTGDDTLTGTSAAFIKSYAALASTCRTDSLGRHHDPGIAASTRLLSCQRYFKGQVPNPTGFRLL